MNDQGGDRQSRIKPQARRSPMNRYYRGNPSPASPFVKKVAKPSWRAKLAKYFDALLVVVLIFCFIYSLIVKPDPKVIASNKIYEPAQVYQNAAAKDLHAFKDRTKLSFDENSLISSLQKQFPEIQSAKVELPIVGQKPIIHLTISQPMFLFENNGQTYVLAANGVLVARAVSLPSADKLQLINDQSGYRARLGKAAISSTEVNFINQVVAQCQKSHIPISSLTLPPAVQELDLKTTDQKYVVKFYLGGDPLLQTGQFLAARRQLSTTHQEPSQYLDVRVPGKIFFK